MSPQLHPGDDGNTFLLGGGRVPKDHARMKALGAIEELNAHLGVCRATAVPVRVDQILERLQSELVDLGREVLVRRTDLINLKGDPPPPFQSANVDQVETDLRTISDLLPPQTEHLLPGGHHAAAMLHYGRTLARKAERRIVPLARVDRIPGAALRYLNRLSELLFQLARFVNHDAGLNEPAWQPLDQRTET